MKNKFISSIENFSFAQMTSNSDGKTSSSGTIGVLICVSGTLGFLLGCIDKLFFSGSSDLITQSIIFVGIGVGLLGYRKYKDGSESEISKLENVAHENQIGACGNKCKSGNCDRCK